MSTPSASETWLENAAGERFPLGGNFSFGRSADNQFVILSERVSRRHAVIHAQEGEYWLADLGSTNGTSLNGRRLIRPTRLREGDQVAIAGTSLTFHQTEATGAPGEAEAAFDVTVMDVRTAPCWLMVADLADFTTLSQRVAPEALATLVGGWIRVCREQIETHGGVINKYLGDGFIAFWQGDESAAGRLAGALTSLREVRRTSEIGFRVVVHFGDVALGGGGSHTEESLMGPAVNYVFRMEKAAGAEGADICVSAAAEKHLGTRLALTALPGRHELKGFAGQHSFFALAV